MKLRFKEKCGSELIFEIAEPSSMRLECGSLYDIEKHHELRSLNANAYFHVLVDKLSKKVGISFTACKNELITSYGQIELLDGEPVVYISPISPDVMREHEEIHAKFYKEENKHYWYRLYRGSHTYNSAEMAYLIDHTVEECRIQDIAVD